MEGAWRECAYEKVYEMIRSVHENCMKKIKSVFEECLKRSEMHEESVKRSEALMKNVQKVYKCGEKCKKSV